MPPRTLRQNSKYFVPKIPFQRKPKNSFKRSRRSKIATNRNLLFNETEFPLLYIFINNKRHKVLPVDQLSRLFDNVPLEVNGSQEIIGNRLIYGNYVDGYDLVDDLGDHLLGEVAICDKWLNYSDHVPGSFVKLDKRTIVQLSNSKEL